ncbi:sensor histidine kinase [Microbacterium sp.]|uniref:sensor histidine kinase n=1 Tax=Microbacterium sp. TaxID=51671 RepID=UPI0027371E56|nr:histidine kinase [Microbacterium sp.]MDP3952999.1 histidine kinase [Microbacterium sp.]
MEIDRPRWRLREWPIAAGVVLVAVLLLFIGGGSSDAGRWVALVGNAIVTVLILIWAVRRLRHQRKRYEDELTVWAAQRAADGERLRIAGELHDLVSHGLGLITVRAAAAQRVTGTDGEAERIIALGDIEDAGRETTTELRRMLTVLRTPGGAPLRPADTLDDLPAIVAAASASGLTVNLETADLPDVSPGVQLTVCAIVREALNNTIRHAGPTHAHVVVRHDGDTVLVDIDDAGPAVGWTSQPGAGHGLTGLRERVTVLGGTVSTHQKTDGFHIAARIPDRVAS